MKNPRITFLSISLSLNLFGIINFINGNEDSGQKMDYISLPYRDIKYASCISRDASFICNCHNLQENLFLPQLDGNVFQVLITNCESLTVGPHFLERVQGLRKVTFQNIKELTLQENSLNLKVNDALGFLTFENVEVIQIYSYAIKGNIENIVFHSSGIEMISAYGIAIKSQLGIITFDSMYIHKIERYAFAKFSFDKLIIKNSFFTLNLPSQCFYELKIQQLLIENVVFKNVNYKAFEIDEINTALIINNSFTKVDSFWISAGLLSGILLENNNFGKISSTAFKGLHQHKDYIKSTKIELRLNDNIIQHNSILKNIVFPLEFDGEVNILIRNLTFLNRFPCDVKKKIRSNSFYKVFGDTVYFATKQGFSDFESVKKILETECEDVSYTVYIIASSIILLVIILATVLVIIWYMKRKAAAQKLKKKKFEPRTYEQTQIVFRVENAGLLKTDL